MAVLYRFKTDLVEFETVGRLEQAHGLYLLRVSASVDEALAVERQAKTQKPVEVHAIVDNQVVLPTITTRVKARPNGHRMELACILG